MKFYTKTGSSKYHLSDVKGFHTFTQNYRDMPFSKGQKIFALLFMISFAIMLIMAYRSDLKMMKVYYKNAWITLIGIALILALLVLLVKLTH